MNLNNYNNIQEFNEDTDNVYLIKISNKNAEIKPTLWYADQIGTTAEMFKTAEGNFKCLPNQVNGIEHYLVYPEHADVINVYEAY